MIDFIQALEVIREYHEIQGKQTMDDYMQGLYNGLELALATLEGRSPEFLTKPDGGWPEYSLEFVLQKIACTEGGDDVSEA